MSIRQCGLDAIQQELTNFSTMYFSDEKFIVNDDFIRIFHKAISLVQRENEYKRLNLGDLPEKLQNLVECIDLEKSDKLHVSSIIDVIANHISELTKPMMLNFLERFEEQWKVLGYKSHHGLFSLAECELILDRKLDAIKDEIKINVGTIEEFKAVIQVVAKTPSEAVFILKPVEGDGHILPLFLRNSSLGVEIICLDSAGKIRGWESIVEELAEINIPFHYYFLETVRQTDLTSCGVFTISDIKNYFKLKKSEFDLFKQIRENSRVVCEYENEIIVYSFEDLPPLMMKLNQRDPGKILEYLSSPVGSQSDYSHQIVNKKRNEHLQANIEHYSIEKSQGNYNIHAEVAFVRYSKILLQQHGII